MAVFEWVRVRVGLVGFGIAVAGLEWVCLGWLGWV